MNAAIEIGRKFRVIKVDYRISQAKGREKQIVPGSRSTSCYT